MKDQYIKIDFHAKYRTLLANERTLLSYWRTSLACWGLGAFLIRLVPSKFSYFLAIGSIIFGTILFGYGIFRYFKLKEEINNK